MARVVVPVRYPLSDPSRRTLIEGVRIANERGAGLTVLHVDLYQNSRRVSRTDLRRAVKQAVSDLPTDTRYIVREGFVVEETILDEVAAEEADVVVIGHERGGRLRRLLRRLSQDPDIERYLQDRLDCTIVRVGTEVTPIEHAE
jgi:nucleotide-binding universal stress UspA family protein